MKHRLPATLLTALLVACGASEQAGVPSDLASRFDSTASPDTAVYRAIAHVDTIPHNGEPGDARSQVTFADSTSLEIPIRGAKLLLELPVQGRASWLLLSGAECSECDANIAVWVFRAIPGRLTKLQLGFAYPGEMTEAGLDTTPYFRSRLFLGACLDTAVPAAVWLEEILQPDSARTRRVRVLDAAPTLGERVLAWTEETEARIRSSVSAGSCREVTPIEQFVA